jgi:hypothetical protein
MHLLSSLAAAAAPARLHAALGRREFVLDAAALACLQRAKRARLAGPGLFPEQRQRFLFGGGDGGVMLVRRGGGDKGGSGDDGGGDGGGGEAAVSRWSGPRDEPRGGEPPRWLAAGLPSVGAAAAAALLEDSIFFEPFGREDAGRLLTEGCECQVGVLIDDGGQGVLRRRPARGPWAGVGGPGRVAAAFGAQQNRQPCLAQMINGVLPNQTPHSAPRLTASPVNPRRRSHRSSWT